MPLMRGVAGCMAMGSITGMLLTYKKDPVVSSRPSSITSVADVYNNLGVGVNALGGGSVRNVFVTNGGTGRLSRGVLLSPINTNTDGLHASATIGLTGRVGFSIVENGVSRVGALTLKDNAAGNISTSMSSTMARRGLSGTITFMGSCTGGSKYMVTVANTVSLMDSNRGYCMVHGNHPRVDGVAKANYRLSNVAATFVITGPSGILRTATTTIYAVKLTNRVTFTGVTRASNGSACHGQVVSTVCGVSTRALRGKTGCRLQWGEFITLYHGQRNVTWQ